MLPAEVTIETCSYTVAPSFQWQLVSKHITGSNSNQDCCTGEEELPPSPIYDAFGG